MEDKDTHFQIRGLEVQFNGHNMNKMFSKALFNFVEGDYKSLGSTLGSGLAKAANGSDLFLY